MPLCWKYTLYPEAGGSIFLPNDGTCLLNYMALLPRRQRSSHSIVACFSVDHYMA